jgi:hypothetical protein
MRPAFAPPTNRSSQTPRITAVVLCGWMGVALAQTSTIAPPQPYQDRVIEGLAADDAEERSARAYDASGLPRGYSLESLWDQRKSQGQRTRSLGLRASAYIDTENYGSLSGQLTAQSNSPGDSGVSSFVLRQIGMPFDGGWRADNALGMINLSPPELARTGPRISLPAPAMRGVSTLWQQGRPQGDTLSLQAAWGEAGRFGGFPVSRFDASQGRYGLLSAQAQRAESDGLLQWAAAAGQARGTPSAFSLTPAATVNAEGLYTALRREWTQGNQAYLQFNALANRSAEQTAPAASGPSASGVWLDGGLTQGAHQTTAGVFRLQPSLSWLDTPMPSDLQGVYARHAWRTRQWQIESGLELLDSISGTTSKGYFANGSARYQYSSAASFGGAISLRNYGVTAQSVLTFTQFANDWGSTRLQLDLARADTGERQQRVQLDHDWSFVQSMRLSTSLSLDRDRRPTGSSRGVGAAVNAEWLLGPNFSMTHSVQSRWADAANQYSLSSGLNWRFAPGWSLLANLYAITGSTNATALAQSPLTAPTAATPRTQDRGIFVALRYEENAGRARTPLGGRVGAGAGRLVGSVYLDANKSEARDASEQGAPNVTVLLDGRFATQTDTQGRFEFPFVAAGEHTLTVVSDNLPLPWLLDKGGRSDGRTSVRVYTRETSQVDIGATRP